MGYSCCEMSPSPDVLEVPVAKLIDLEFLHDVFSHQEFFEVKTFLDIEDTETLATLSSLGFTLGRAFSKGKTRFQRVRLTRFDFVEMLALEKIDYYLPDGTWEFVFDSAKQRAGLCNYTDRQISLSRYIVDHHSIDQSMQVVLHEIAHALAGKSAGHGPTWKAQAKALGYKAEKFTGREIAEQTAKWIGECRNGHLHYRYRSPKVKLACGYCGRGFNPRNVIRWEQRV